MMKLLLRSAMLLCLLVWAPLAVAETQDGQETYDLLFRQGTLDGLDRAKALVYRRDVINVLRPESETRDTGAIALALAEDGGPLARITFRQGERSRVLGQFPSSVGNPMIMYFYETTVRDMAESAGGSPFYIRNRVKEALVQPSDVVAGEAVINGKTIATKTVRLFPFEGDPNQARMRGFGDLTLIVTMAEEVPGWYVKLVAEALHEGQPVYRSELAFEGLEDAR